MLNLNAISQVNEKKVISAIKANEHPKIDAVLDDPVWQNATIAKDFIQHEPYNGKYPSYPTEVRMVYDNHAIYFGVILYDSNPDSILQELSLRDKFDEANADLFAIVINPFDDGFNGVEFLVSAAGVQSDAKHIGEEGDSNWDAVWESAVKITEQGWVVEYKIPYSSLRFPNTPVQTWGINFFRNIRRYREWSSWNYVDNNAQEIISQSGQLADIKDIEPPLRLSVTPYISSYLENNENGNWSNNFNAGMDLKWGINQSFTLDMILIPDFGQVQSDDEILNLTPYEIMYDEKRAFFTEGTELFNKAGIFYSRRIGGRPKFKSALDDVLDSTEIIIENPVETKLLNATKVSGRTNRGLGIGFFNAMTSAVDGIIQDTLTNVKRRYQTQGFTNYNMIVLDQSLKNNSYVSLVNTNVLYDSENYIANVTGTEALIKNKENTYQLFARGTLSQIYTDSSTFGHAYFLQFAKIKGQFLFELNHNTESDTYDPNDFGYLQSNNESSWSTEIEYNVNKPFWRVLNWQNELEILYKNLYQPRKFTDFNINLTTQTTFAKKYLTTRLTMGFYPVETHDYYETRVYDFDWMFKRPRYGFTEGMISTDYRKTFAIDIVPGAWKAFDYDRYGYWLFLSPRIRFSDKWMFIYTLGFDNNYNTFGHVDHYENTDGSKSIFFGKRDQLTISNTLNTNYIFNNKSSLGLRLRHYWSRVEYDDYYQLLKSGYLTDAIDFDIYGKQFDTNYNAFTIDLQYLWRFAPGSELSIVWKNSINYERDIIINNFWNNLEHTLGYEQVNSISLKFLYYLDYQYLKRK
ncbi:MAG: hypothetical protein A2X13_12935 [Bacteroidetes bacterium GWC2_33_15]|nr:MAG: hypothetical protein A2X10_13760 [Bacteroidetes bacterium GWA2_33_15]OFX50684.1 MAG: hypothetical protein A2X13_12935 [Bacteroidetes bacterium GWC2_33_15]OFX63220.1 MAG: hypothetical protein A2X15_01865 [Bacteroidetes bacterium GWB2_32_14]OFX69833.1 MAG: hypothetical protein A2X14_05610 [Bacteroidetes bacterium GWD2_33_33]HAN19879.1 hypothetical protein [Bacteroidales bacterium]